MHIGPILSKRRDSKFKKLIPVFLISLCFKRYTKFSKNSKININTQTQTQTHTHRHRHTHTGTHRDRHRHGHTHTHTTHTHTHTHTHTCTQITSSLYQYFLNQIKENFLVLCFKTVLIKKSDSLDAFILNVLPCLVIY